MNFVKNSTVSTKWSLGILKNAKHQNLKKFTIKGKHGGEHA